MRLSVILVIFAVFFGLLIEGRAEKKVVGGLLVDYDNNGEILRVQNLNWDPEKVLEELKALHRDHPFSELELISVDPSPKLIEFIATLSNLTHLTIGGPPEGVFIEDKTILKKLGNLKNLSEVTLCVRDLEFTDISFLENMEKVWKVTVYRSE